MFDFEIFKLQAFILKEQDISVPGPPSAQRPAEIKSAGNVGDRDER